MTKKIAVFAFAFALGLGVSAVTWQRVSDAVEKTVVMLSGDEWAQVKRTMDRRGVCEIEGQDVVLVITNGIPEVEHFISTLLDEDKDFRRQGPKASPNNTTEPLPYDQQSR